MQVNITPVQVSITSPQTANVLTAEVNHDDGTSCDFVYTLVYSATGSPNRSIGRGKYTLDPTDYAAYVAAGKSSTYVTTYVAAKIPVTIVS